MSSATFDSIINGVTKNQDHFEAQIPPSWMQGRASFGGLVAALGVEAMQQTLLQRAQSSTQKLPPLRSIQVLFVGPVGVDPIRIETQVLRQGRNVTSVRADLIQEGQVCCSVMACFGASRKSVLSLGMEDRPVAADPESLARFDYVEGLTPKFTQQFDMRWAEGGKPFTNSHSRTHGIWTRFYDEGKATNLHLIALADIPPPIGLSMLTEPANGSSLTWSLEFLGDELDANLQDWWYIKTQLLQSSQGYSQQQYTIWAPDGQAVAIANQVMTVFA